MPRVDCFSGIRRSGVSVACSGVAKISLPNSTSWVMLNTASLGSVFEWRYGAASKEAGATAGVGEYPLATTWTKWSRWKSDATERLLFRDSGDGPKAKEVGAEIVGEAAAVGSMVAAAAPRIHTAPAVFHAEAYDVAK